MVGWRGILVASVFAASLLSGCVGDDGSPAPRVLSTDDTAEGARPVASNGTLFRFDGPDGPYNTSFAYEDSLSVCPQYITCEPNWHPLPADVPAGLVTVIRGAVHHEPQDYTLIVEFTLDDGDVLTWRNDWTEPGVTSFAAVLDVASGSGELSIRAENSRTEETSYQLSALAWADPTVVPHGSPVRLDLAPGANLSVQAVTPPHDEDGVPEAVDFAVYDGRGQPVIRHTGEDSNVTIRIPADVSGGPFSFVPNSAGSWARLLIDAEASRTMQRFELERTFGPPHLLASAEPVSWSEEIDEVPIRGGVYLRSDGAWLMTPAEGHVRVSSPVGVIVDRDIGCPVPVPCVAPTGVEVPVASSYHDPLLSAGAYEFEVTPGGWGFTHAGSYLVTLPG